MSSQSADFRNAPAFSGLRTTSLLQANGNLGLIATNTVAQGDSRQVGLDAMVADGFTITRAIQSRSWPAASANLEYAAVWGTSGQADADVPRVADGVNVRRISTLLEPAGRVEGLPERLRENAGIGFIGCYVLGMGFVVDPVEAQEWIAADPRNAEVLFPYLNGEDLNSRPDASASRWVIDFNDRSEAEAATYYLPYQRLTEAVKPERQRLKPSGEYVVLKHRAERWWQYGANAPRMRAAVARMSEVLVIALVSKTVMLMRAPTGQVFSHKLGVFASASYSTQAVLSSSLHQVWAVKYGSTMRADVNYSPSDVFETFPMPEENTRMDSLGRSLDQTRRAIMLRRNLGLTKLYNMINDPGIIGDEDIDQIRELHSEIDEATINSFGWDDLSPGHGFHEYRKMVRWTISPAARVEILDRLLLENHRREHEGRGGMGLDGRRGPDAEGTLFG